MRLRPRNTNGPFGNSNAPYGGGQCTPVPRGAVATIGATSFRNSGSGQERIDKVTLVGAHSLRLVAAWAVPITGTDLLGVFPGNPPLGLKGDGLPKLEPGVQWSQRERADGAVIPHTLGQDEINLVLVVRPSGVLGTSKTVYVDYESGGTHYRLDLHFYMQVFNGNQQGCENEQPA